MSDQLLLRFRELTANVATIQAHNDVVAKHQFVLWGWWKKPPELMPDPALTMLATEVKSNPGQYPIFFISSADSTLYRSQLHEIFFQPGGPELGPPYPELCPSYYKDKQLPAWFRIGRIEKVETSELSHYIFSTANRTAFNRTITALDRRHIGQVVRDTNFLDSNLSLWFVTLMANVEFAQRTEVVKPLSRGVWPCKGRFALHISDLHFGAQHAFRNELGSVVEPRLAQETAAEALLNDFETINLKPDDIALVLITGDLSWTGDAHEFANAESFIDRLRNACGLHISQIVLIPGNHDVEWRDEKGDIDPNAELNFSHFTRNLYHSEPEQSLLRIHQFTIENREVCIVALNSCRIESRANAGLGFVGREQIQQALRFLKQETRDSQQLRIALLHHHLLPVNYVEGIDYATKRLSLTLDAEAVIRSLVSAHVPIVLHGHQHQPYVSQIRRVVQDFVDPFGFSPSRSQRRVDCLDGTLTVIGGGSLGARRAHLNVVGRNTYNILDLGEPGKVAVRTRVQSSVGPGFSDYQTFEFDL